MTETFTFDTPTSTFSVDVEKRIIKGLALPYNKVAKKAQGAFQFAKGTLTFTEAKRVKLLANHKWENAVGHAVALDDTDDGLVVAFKVARGAAGDLALSMAEDGVWDGLSVGVDITDFQEKDGVMHVTAGRLSEVSLTPCPAFDDARVTSVAASRENTKEVSPMTEAVTPETGTVDGLTLDAITDAVKSAVAEAPAVIQPVAFEVVEEAPYRFDGGKGAHDFSTDLIAGLRDNDSEAKTRVMNFMQEAFDVDTGNVSTLNPTRNRPELYVDQRKYSTPFYSALRKGSLSDMTPFVFPRFASAGNLVNPHVEGVEPTPGYFTATNQTVTPSAVSGKVEITREVWDQGGSPQVSRLIWDKMVYAYFQALESSAVAMLDDASPEVIALPAGATDAALVDALEAEIAELNFIAGGNVFSFAGTHIDLYKALAAASDSTGRKLLPIINPSNANGRSTAGFRSLDVAGTTFTPAWSLGGSDAESGSSYLVDTDSVHVWNSAPQRLEFQYRVAYVDLAIWGYVAAAISDLTGVREVTYDASA